MVRAVLDRLDWVLILLGLALYLPSASAIFMMLYIFKFFVTCFSVPFSELSVAGLALDLIDEPLSCSAMTIGCVT